MAKYSLRSYITAFPPATEFIADTGNSSTNGDNLRTALALAAGGTIIELAPGGIYKGSFTLPAGVDSRRAILRTRGYGGAGWPINGRRANPTHAALMAKLVGPDSFGFAGDYTLGTTADTCNWDIYGLQVRPPAMASFGQWQSWGLIWLRNDSGAGDQTHPPHDINIRHCLLRGDDVYGTVNGIRNGGNNINIDDTWVDQMHSAKQFGYITGNASTTSTNIATGAKSFTVTAGFDFTTQYPYIVLRSAANHSNYMFGVVTAWSSPALSVTVILTGGSGSHADWEILNYYPGGPEGQGLETSLGDRTTATNCYFSDADESAFVGGIALVPTNVRYDKCFFTHREWMYFQGVGFGTSASEVSYPQGWTAQGTDLVVESHVVDATYGNTFYIVSSASHVFVDADLNKAIIQTRSDGGWTASYKMDIAGIINGKAILFNQNAGLAADSTTGGVWRMDVKWSVKNNWESKDGSGILTTGSIIDYFYASGQEYPVACTQVYNQSPAANIEFRNVFFPGCPKVTSVGMYADRFPEYYTFNNCLMLNLDAGHSGAADATFLATTNTQRLTVKNCTAIATMQMLSWTVSLFGSHLTLYPTWTDNILVSPNLKGPNDGDYDDSGADPAKPWGAMHDPFLSGTVTYSLTYNVFAGGSLWTVDNVEETMKWPGNYARFHNDAPAYAGFIAANFVNAATGNCRLKAGSDYRSDGTKPSSTGGNRGCDIDALYNSFSIDDHAWVLANYPGLIP